MKSLTNEQSQILSKLIDANWEADNLDNDYNIRDIARQEYYKLKRQLIESMGSIEFIEFMNFGSRMFAAKSES
jgi:hypothetical protein